MKIKFLLPLVLGLAAVCSAQINNGGGGGTVTHTAGNLTANAAVFGNGTADLKVDSAITTDDSGNLTAASASVPSSASCTAGAANNVKYCGAPGLRGSEQVPFFSGNQSSATQLAFFSSGTTSWSPPGGQFNVTLHAPASPTAPVVSAGGSLAATTQYFYEVTTVGIGGVCNVNDSTVSPEVSGTTTSSNKTIAFSWSAVTGALSYCVYRATGSSGGENQWAAVAGLSFTDDGVTPVWTAASPRTLNAAIGLEISPSGLVLGNGTIASVSGNTTVAATTSGTLTNGHFAGFDASGNIVDKGASSATAWNAITNPAGNQALTMAANTTAWTWNAATGAGVNLFTITDTTSNTGTGALVALPITASSALTNALLIQNNPTTSQTLTTLSGMTLQAATAADATHAYNSPPLIFNARAAHGGTDANQNWQMVNVMGSNANDPTSTLAFTFSGTSTGAAVVQVPKLMINTAAAGVNLKVAATNASTTAAQILAATSPTSDVFDVNTSGGTPQTYTDSQFHWAHINDIAGLNSDFTTASSAVLQNITGLSFALPQSKAQNLEIECHLMYSQATNVSDQIGIQFNTNAPTRADFRADATLAGPGANVPSYGVLANLTTTTATAIVTFTPTATTTNYADIYGWMQMPSSGGSGTVQIMSQQSTAGDLIVWKAGSYCRIW